LPLPEFNKMQSPCRMPACCPQGIRKNKCTKQIF